MISCTEIHFKFNITIRVQLLILPRKFVPNTGILGDLPDFVIPISSGKIYETEVNN